MTTDMKLIESVLQSIKMELARGEEISLCGHTKLVGKRHVALNKGNVDAMMAWIDEALTSNATK